jgi:hypothetical protein
MFFAVEDRQNKGYITVEASIIVPVVILSILAVIYLGLLLYQRSLLQSAAGIASEMGASAWASGISELSTGRPYGDSFEKIKLYRRIFDASEQEKLTAIKEYAKSNVERNGILKPLETSVDTVIKNYAISRRLEVTISSSYRIPAGGLVKLFGGSGSITLKVKAVSSIDEPAELIRTTDFIIDLEKELENNNPGIKNLGQKTRGAMTELKDRLEQFLN